MPVFSPATDDIVSMRKADDDPPSIVGHLLRIRRQRAVVVLGVGDAGLATRTTTTSSTTCPQGVIRFFQRFVVRGVGDAGLAIRTTTTTCPQCVIRCFQCFILTHLIPVFEFRIVWIPPSFEKATGILQPNRLHDGTGNGNPFRFGGNGLIHRCKVRDQGPVLCVRTIPAMAVLGGEFKKNCRNLV